jgi:carboxypeptidase family protein
MNGKRGLAWFAAMAMVAAVGCGGGGESAGGGAAKPAAPSPAAKAPTEAAAPAAAPAPAGGGGATGSAAVKGSVKFEGAAPKRAKIQMAADPFCQKAHGDATSEEVVVNANGTLKNVFVYVKTGLEGKQYPVPSTPAVIDQHGCSYAPHVLGMMAGQTLKVLNSDDTLHNIHALPKVNAQFNLAMPKYVKEKEQKFDKPEVMIPVKCDVHSWMASYIGVLTHPYYSVSGDDGSFDLSKLPAGTYTIEAWHEKYGAQTQEVTVGDGESKEITFSFKAS